MSSLVGVNQFQCADYIVSNIVLSTSTSPFSGTGTINMPIVGLVDAVQMDVTFNNIVVNSNHCVTVGVIDIKGASVLLLLAILQALVLRMPQI